MVLILIAGVTQAVASDIISTFDSGWDGWTACAASPAGPGQLSTWQPAGGNPGGYIDFVDEDGGDGGISAPAAFLGNWSSLDGVGQLRWDSIIFSPGTPPLNFASYPWATITGPGGSATWHVPGTDNTQWETFTAPISSSDWTMNSGSWSSLLADVTSLVITDERVGNGGPPGDHDGLDNVVLSSTPEPSTLVLLGIGAVSLLAYGWRKRTA